MSLYHYTSIENLALILKNKTIRFSRLDCVDDVEESTVYEKTVQMGKYTFVSCWTDNEEESIPLWNLYTPGMKGVRIKMNSSDIFYKYKHKPGVYHTSAGNVTINAEIESYFTFEEQFNDKYCILSQGVDDDDFIRKVEYSKDYKKQSQAAVNYTFDTGSPFLNVTTREVGKYKNERWAFQEEIRFALTILPTVFNPVTQKLDSIRAIQFGVELPIKFYDLRMNDAAFSSMEITTGPHCTNSDQIIVESLVNNLNPTATIYQSKLHGSLRKK